MSKLIDIQLFSKKLRSIKGTLDKAYKQISLLEKQLEDLQQHSSNNLNQSPLVHPAPNDAKDYYSIGELAKMLNVNTYTIRYWQKEFGIELKHKGFQRRFHKEEVEIFKAINKLRYEEGYGIEATKRLIKPQIV